MKDLIKKTTAYLYEINDTKHDIIGIYNNSIKYISIISTVICIKYLNYKTPLLHFCDEQHVNFKNSNS